MTYNAPDTISLNWRTISASARIVRSFLIAASFQFTHFSQIYTKQPVKQSHDKVSHYDTPFAALNRHLFTQRLFQDWTQQCHWVPKPGSILELIPGRVCVHTEGTPAILQQFSGTNCVKGVCVKAKALFWPSESRYIKESLRLLTTEQKRILWMTVPWT